MAKSKTLKGSEAVYRISRKTKQLFLAGTAGAVLTGVILAGLMFYQSEQMNEERSELQYRLESEIRELKADAANNKVQGYVLNREFTAGHAITMEDLTLVELPKDSVPPDLLKTKEAVAGKIIKLSVRPNTLLTESLLYEEEAASDDLRFREMGFIQLPAALRDQDIVDVRVQFPTGQDYILLSKKKIRSLHEGIVTMTLNEEEILSLSSAIVDAYLHKASIYALLYVEPSLQAKAVPTYPANEAVLQLIKKDPNIVERAERALNLSSRIGLEADLAGLSAGAAAEFAGQQASAGSSIPMSDAEQQFVMGPSD